MLVVKLTLDGSSPATPTVHPMPLPSAMFTRFFTTVVLPLLGGPTTMTRGPFGPSGVESAPSPPRRDRMRSRSSARCRLFRCGCVVDVEVY